MEYLKVWTSFREAMKPLNDAEKGRLFDAMLLYAETGEEPDEFTGNERFLWAVARQDIDRTFVKCEKLRANGSKGGLAKAENRIANDSKAYQNVANDTKEQTEEAKDSRNIKKYNIKKNNTNKFIPPTPEQVAEYCRERGNNIDPEYFVAYYAKQDWLLSNGRKMKDWKMAIVTWEKNDKAKPAMKKAVPAQQYEQRDYSGVNEEMRSQTDELMKQFMSERGAG